MSFHDVLLNNEISGKNDVLWKLQERVKELTALHQVANVLQTDCGSVKDILHRIIDLLPSAWQYPDITSARLTYGKLIVTSKHFADGKAVQSATFQTFSKKEGLIEVKYLKEMPESDEGPFLNEERMLIDSVAQMIKAFLDRRLFRQALKRSNQRLECQVKRRTVQLEKINLSLKSEVLERQRAERKIRKYKEDLQKLVSELVRTEERERRAIAEDLHDHLGQALSMLKMRLLEFHGEAMFYGMEGRVDELSGLLNKIIKYTRNLTSEICPPVLYELGLFASIDWLSERFCEKYGLQIKLGQSGTPFRLPEELEGALFKGTRELLTNIVKHAQVKTAVVELHWFKTSLELRVSDAGAGFNQMLLKKRLIKENCFGLFSLKERIRFFGGQMKIESQCGSGTNVQIILPLIARDSKS
ncbi:MAG: hypothetical protein HQM10_08405 [Candidatus Riflebacteria bacterium]|nr:hypothetical protein [Candidatus Riflebacteria bacterium]